MFVCNFANQTHGFSGVHPPGNVAVFVLHTHPFRRFLRLFSFTIHRSHKKKRYVLYLPYFFTELAAVSFPRRGAIPVYPPFFKSGHSIHLLEYKKSPFGDFPNELSAPSIKEDASLYQMFRQLKNYSIFFSLNPRSSPEKRSYAFPILRIRFKTALCVANPTIFAVSSRVYP